MASLLAMAPLTLFMNLNDLPTLLIDRSEPPPPFPSMKTHGPLSHALFGKNVLTCYVVYRRLEYSLMRSPKIAHRDFRHTASLSFSYCRNFRLTLRIFFFFYPPRCSLSFRFLESCTSPLSSGLILRGDLNSSSISGSLRISSLGFSCFFRIIPVFLDPFAQIAFLFLFL